jgi:hypothetical protein
MTVCDIWKISIEIEMITKGAIHRQFFSNPIVATTKELI